MRVKRVRRMCMVKGCRNIGCYTLTAGREFGNSVIICGDCLKKANEEVEKMHDAECSVQNEETELVEEPAVEEVIQNPDAEPADEVEAEDVIESDASAVEKNETELVEEPASEENAVEAEPSEEKKTETKKTTSKKGTKK